MNSQMPRLWLFDNHSDSREAEAKEAPSLEYLLLCSQGELCGVCRSFHRVNSQPSSIPNFPFSIPKTAKEGVTAFSGGHPNFLGKLRLGYERTLKFLPALGSLQNSVPNKPNETTQIAN
jgi:hypothetical protein